MQKRLIKKFLKFFWNKCSTCKTKLNLKRGDTSVNRKYIPSRTYLKNTIGNGWVMSAESKKEIILSDGAIEMNIKVNAPDYPKDKVREAVKEICQKAVQYYD